MPVMPPQSLLGHLRYRAGQVFMDATWTALAQTRLLPNARPERHGVERLLDIPYTSNDQAHHRLDVYRPAKRKGPLPALLYIHG